MPTEAAPITMPVDRGMFDPAPELGRLREQTPLRRMLYSDGHVGWLVTSYELARQVLGDERFSMQPASRVRTGDPETRSAAAVDELRSHPRLAKVFDRYVNSGKAEYEAFDDPEVLDILRNDPPGLTEFIVFDPPLHTKFRRLVARYFTPRRAREHQQLIENIVAQRLDAMEQGGGPVDLVEMFCLPIPSTLLSALLGVSPEERHRFEEPQVVAGDPNSTAEQRVAAEHAAIDFARDVIRRKRTNPGDDLLSELAQTGELSDDELVALAKLLFRAGHDTTQNMMALSVLALLQDRTRWDALRADPTMVGTAVEEFLRFMTLIQVGAFNRTALQNVELAGHTIQAGETVTVSLAAANRDPERFADPDRLDLARKDAPGHLAFGHGVHQCLGQHFARLELRIGLTALARRFPDLRLAIPIDEVPLHDGSMFVYGVHRLPVTW
ncbi:cytochrome P450 [Rhodococcus sp. NPDC059968]|uniref:cytochrome P450 n=1 Tax=Rhodococcus sp. NPDC059968 TaxID=3347017 RepID=UPI0036718896